MTQDQSFTTQACDSTASPGQLLSLPECWLVSMPSTLTTLVSSSKWSGWRGWLEFSGLSWAAVWMSWPWASTNKRAMQAIPGKGKNNTCPLKYYLKSCLNMNQILKCKILQLWVVFFQQKQKLLIEERWNPCRPQNLSSSKLVQEQGTAVSIKLTQQSVVSDFILTCILLQLNYFFILCVILVIHISKL